MTIRRLVVPVAMACLAMPLFGQNLVQRRLRLAIGAGPSTATVIGRCLVDRGDSLVLQSGLGPIQIVARRDIKSADVEVVREPGRVGWGALPGLGLGAALGFALASTRARSDDVAMAVFFSLPGLVIGGRGEPAAKKVAAGAAAGGVLLGVICLAAGGGIGGCGDDTGEQVAYGALAGGALGADIGAVVSFLSKEAGWRRMSPDGWRVTLLPASTRLLVGVSHPFRI